MERSWPTPPSDNNQSLYLWALEIVKLLRTGEILTVGSVAESVVSTRVATTVNVALTTALEAGDTLDGVVLAANDLVLVKDQTAPAENGIYLVPTSGTAFRYTPFNTFDSYPGLVVTVQEGTAGADTIWVSTANKGGTLGVTAIPFSRLDAANMAASTIKGRAVGAGTGPAQDLTGIQAAAILPDASTSQRGLVELATDAEIWAAATGNLAVTAASLESASASVTIADAATIAVDWDTFIFGTVTLGGNRTLGNPTNVQIGTWRTIWAQGDVTGGRQLSFAGNYVLNTATLTGINQSTGRYVIPLFGLVGSFVLVGAPIGPF